MVPPKYLSVTGAHDCPALMDLKTPPPVVPIQNSSGRDGLPVAATDRPPRNGPTSRQRSPANATESRCAARPVRAIEERTVERRKDWIRWEGTADLLNGGRCWEDVTYTIPPRH